MGTNYGFDRNFTNTVHNNLAVPQIYEELGWSVQDIDSDEAERADMFEGIDYFLTNQHGQTVTVQERFREYKYHPYTDFTIRFEREFNPHIERHLSEYYKLNADYFVYGIINTSKFNVENATEFVKFAVVDLHVIKQLTDEGKIVIDRSVRGLKCVMQNGVMHCPVNYNRDGSSSFFPVDIKFLVEYFSEYRPVVFKKGI